ncbi:MAG: formyltetrahydrofolate deformylase [Acidimicrobiales bacterium]|nr:formyltetrahydrofolate deformylase [Acidimicrobiales bacterium]
MPVHILTMTCPDRPGIVASMAQGLLELDANIIDNAQHGDAASGLFCMRTRFDVAIDDAEAVAAALAPQADALGAELRVRREDAPPRVLVLVSKHDHCLIDLLQRWRAGELPVRLAGVVSNHPDLAHLADAAGVPFDHVPVTTATKPAAEQRLRDLVAERDADLVVLARYMQILSDELTRDLDGRVINIHHSFLPGFKGAKPYHQAWERGVKLIGATAHFVTGDLDEGPIIEQDVTRVHHGVSAEEMVVLGKDIERVVLSRAVKAWAEGRVFLVGQRTVVFP